MTNRHRWGALGGLVVVLLLAAACQPAATPTTAAPAAAPKAAAGKIFLMVDMVQGSTNLTDEEKPTKSCVLNSRFPKNSQIVWRARVFDQNTGDVLSDKDVKDVVIKLANGTNIPMKFGPHPKDPPNEVFWTGSWVIPKDAPSGTLNYAIVGTAIDGRTGEFKPFPTATSLLTITDQVLQDVVAKPKA